jgi:hypothetical protein
LKWLLARFLEEPIKFIKASNDRALKLIVGSDSVSGISHYYGKNVNHRLGSAGAQFPTSQEPSVKVARKVIQTRVQRVRGFAGPTKERLRNETDGEEAMGRREQ